MRFYECRHCGLNLTPGHVVQSVNIPNSSNYVAVLLRCPQCQENTKMVDKRERFDRDQKKYDAYMGRFEQEYEVAHGEIADIEILAELQELWSKTPPLIEELRGKCKCKACMRKWYVYDK